MLSILRHFFRKKETPKDNYNTHNPNVDSSYKIDIKNDLDAIFAKYKVTPDNLYFYSLGEAVNHKDELEELINHTIKPIFKNINQETEALFQTRKNELNSKIEICKSEVELYNKKIDPESGEYLREINAKISDIKQKISESKNLEEAFFQEKNLVEIINKSYEEYSINLGVLKAAHVNDLDTLLKSRKVIELSKSQAKFIETIKKTFSNYIHSNLYPPSNKYIWLFSLLSFLLLFGEIAFSYQIAFEIVSLESIFSSFGAATTDLINKISLFLLCICMSISISIILKYCIDYLLFSGSRNSKRVFWTIYILICFIILNFYSAGTLDQDKVLNVSWILVSREALFMAFFSISFATANAFLFREVTYLERLRKKIKNRDNLDKFLNDLLGVKNSFIQNTELHISQNNNLATSITSKLKDLSGEMKKNYETIISNYEEMCISTCRRGFNEKLNKTFDQNGEHNLFLKNQLKKEFLK